ncbi:OprD family outer membrane porin [Pseudomonas sp. H9]|uniref:OprD family outer membrane porin n=1 Tax=Pseudomonas sp. H9 TaxID=483968 RepID=UPI001057E3C9|nr:OprD family outer membrane porin [Pseudomonas sp. H9]TDF82311.1 outer membrane porin, OprD family [Pseudomonas sp. H9]
MSRITPRQSPLLALSLVCASSASQADNSLGQRDNINIDLTQRQHAELAIPAGLVNGSSLNGLLRNYYFGRDNHHTPARRDQREWAQGVLLSLRSGYTDTVIGMGLDVHGFSALKLDGGGGRGGAGLMPLDSQGKPQDEFAAAGAALKFRAFDSLLKVGDQLLENPLIASGSSRLFPQSYRGVTIKNFSLDAVMFDAGWVESTRLRNQSGHSDLQSAYGNGNRAGVAPDRESSHMTWLGATYTAPQSLSLSGYSGRLQDLWDQHYLGLSRTFALAHELRLTPYLHYYKTRDQGRSQLGPIDNDAYSAGLTLAQGSQSLTLGLQKIDGDTPFDFLAQNDRTFLYLNNAMQYADFNGPGEKSWKLQYQTSLQALRAPNLQFSIGYTRGEADLTRVDPASPGYGYIYNPDGKHAKHWERDIALRYAVPEGQAKGLNLTLRWASHRPGDGYTAPGNTRGNASADEYRVILDYPFNLL